MFRTDESGHVAVWCAFELAGVAAVNFPGGGKFQKGFRPQFLAYVCLWNPPFTHMGFVFFYGNIIGKAFQVIFFVGNAVEARRVQEPFYRFILIRCIFS